jgi:hypothetical protein
MHYDKDFKVYIPQRNHVVQNVTYVTLLWALSTPHVVTLIVESHKINNVKLQFTQISVPSST